MSRNSKTSAAQQLKLVMECRRSGKTDAQWCIENGIRPATFYNWVSRLRKRGCDIPESNWNELKLPAQHQDVVLLDVIPKPSALVVNDEQSEPVSSNSMLLEINGAGLTIPNGTDSSLLTQVILAMRGSLC